MKKLVCNYSVIRFLPYPETEEFVNVGILACCPQVGWMDYCLDHRKTKRIHDFFPEMDKAIYIEGRHRVIEEMDRITTEFKNNGQQWVMPERQKYLAGIFAQLTHPREEIFRFGAPATRLAENPQKTLQHLYQYYIERHFAKHQEFQETIMRDRITDLLRQNNLFDHYKEVRLGNEDYSVNLPFVHQELTKKQPLKAIKPLNLAYTEATKIREHGDAWCAKMNRLTQMGFIPHHMLFAVHFPPQKDKKRTEAANEICTNLTTDYILVKDFDNTQAVVDFAK